MAIATKLETVAQSCKDIREALNAQNSKLGDSSISALGNEIKNCPKMAIVYKEGNQPVKSKIIFGDGEGNLPSMSALNDNVPHTIVSAIVPKCNTSPSFSQQKSLENLYFEDGITSLGSCEGCVSLKKVIIPNSVTSIVNYGFRNCTKLEEILNLGSVTKLDGGNYNGTFSGCINLDKIILPDSLITLSQGVFTECSKLRIVKAGNNLTQFCTYYTFSNCGSSVGGMIIIIDTINPPTIMTQYMGSIKAIFVPKDLNETIINNYKSASGWSSYTSKLYEYFSSDSLPENNSQGDYCWNKSDNEVYKWDTDSWIRFS